jgi:hypothetical protein
MITSHQYVCLFLSFFLAAQGCESKKNIKIPRPSAGGGQRQSEGGPLAGTFFVLPHINGSL